MKGIAMSRNWRWRRLGLDQVWLLVSPGNPLKPVAGMAPLADRLAGAAAIGDGRRVVATAIEASLGTRYSVDTMRLLRRRFPGIRFVWIMGADILAQLPRWRRWRGNRTRSAVRGAAAARLHAAALAGQAARRLRGRRRPAHEAPVLSRSRARDGCSCRATERRLRHRDPRRPKQGAVS
jgi:nicotinate-nucleotide adenylyltransferase